MGVVTAAASLIDALVKKNPDEYKVGTLKTSQYLLSASIDLYVSFMFLVQNKLMAIFLQGCISLAVSRLSRIVTSSYTDFQAS